MTLQLLGKIQKKSNFIFIFGQMIEDQVLFHLPKFGKNIFSLRVDPATKESFLSSSDAHFFPEIKYFQMSKIYKSYMDRSGGTHPIT